MRRWIAAGTGVLVAVALCPAAGRADPPTRPAPDRDRVVAPDRVAEPDRLLDPRWRTSTDRAVTVSGDETGLHVLVADEKEAYRWQTAATLAEPGIVTDQWIGQLCVTGSGQRAVVVYAPRQFTNRDILMQRGAFAAVVDLGRHTVTKLPVRTSLAYHNPGCGTGETATLTRLETATEGPAHTWIGTVDTSRPDRALVAEVRPVGQVTSVIPASGGLLGVKHQSLVAIGPGGAVSVVAHLDGVPHRLVADSGGGAALQVLRGGEVDLVRYARGSVTRLASVPAGTVRLRPGANGRVYAVGHRAGARVAGRLPAGWKVVEAPPDSDVSTTGALVVTRAVTGREAAGQRVAEPHQGDAGRVFISARHASGSDLRFTIEPPSGAPGRERATDTGRSGPSTASSPDYSTVPYDPDRACAVPRNDPTIQVYQPTPRQAEWAADLAVRGQLTFQRPANWLNNGLPAYSPQGMFPPIPLAGGDHVPAQVMLGILAQESNMWQASYHAVDASAGNPLVSSGFYGISWRDQDPRNIDWSQADCGYGAGQVTTGMRMVDTNQWLVGVQWDYTKQKAVVLDYATNISAALRILQDKWNVTRNAGLIANDGNPRFIENWWFAIWAYNTGFYPRSGAEPWGVGWANNVANQDYPPDRQMFLTAPLDVPEEGIDDEIGYDNAKHPNHWAYPERVIGYAYSSLRRYDYVDRRYASTFLTALDRGKVDAQPDRFTFCTTSVNECDPAAQHVPGGYPGTKPGACLRDDLRCWWHEPVTWVDCGAYCGTEARRYASVEPRPLGTNIYPTPKNSDGTCRTFLPAGSRVIDDIDTTTAIGPEGCRPTYPRGGRFSLAFGSTVHSDHGYTIYPSKVDFHQIGGGYGGHFWFAHTMKPVDGYRSNNDRKVTGTWTIDPTNAWTRVFVHLPDHGAHTRQADYKIYLPGQATATRHRAVPTRWERNHWLEIGVFDFRGSGSPRVELSNFTADGSYVEDIAWDGLAVQPLSAKPSHFIVAMGDSYSSGEGAGAYDRVSNQYGDEPARRSSCRRGQNAWSYKLRLQNSPATIRDLSFSLDTRLDFHFLACSGARTHNVMRTTTSGGGPAPPNASGKAPGGSYGELSQLDAGFLDENTTLVVLTIGGNDAEWSSIAKTCAMESRCQDSVPGGGSQTLRQITEDRIRNKVKPDVLRSINEIRSLAPNALIELAGYPQLFAPGSTYGVTVQWPAGDYVIVGIDSTESVFMADVARLLVTEVLVSDAANRKVAVDVRAAFAGHEVSGGGTPYLQGFLAGDLSDDEDGDPNQLMSMESFHPLASGYDAYAVEVAAHLAAFGYVW